MKLPPRKPLLITIALVIVAALALIFIPLDDAADVALPILEWIEQTGPTAAIWFTLIYLGFVIFLLPSFPLTLAGGFLFGVINGSLLVILATATGSMIAFFAARTFLHQKIAAKMTAYPQLERVSRGMHGPGAWKLVMLCRFVPFFPAKLSNYLFGVTHVRSGAFFVGNLIGIFPYAILNAWIGSLAADLASLGERQERTPLEWALYGFGLVATILVIISITRLARGALEKQLAEQDQPPK